ncbi:MAG: hypothetical protein HOH27_02740, partial [Acidimicrobiaceae bacterium]|nr:hypothetical protein [Acidimicrobiaceae bacterium]
MPLDPRTPVIVGVAQVTDRVDDPSTARTALELMIDAGRSAAIDAGAAGSEASVDVVAVVGGIWSYRDPGRQVAGALGASAATTLLTGLSGTSPQRLLAHLSARIADGELDAALMVGGEVFRSRRRARQLDVVVRRDVDESLAPAERFEGVLDMSTPHEESRGLVEPGVFYPVAESAIRHARGETVDQHRRRRIHPEIERHIDRSPGIEDREFRIPEQIHPFRRNDRRHRRDIALLQHRLSARQPIHQRRPDFPPI